MTGQLTIWLTIDNCLTVTIDGSNMTSLLQSTFFFLQIDMIAAVDKNNETALYEARIAHILQLFRLSHPNIPLHQLPAHGLKRDPNIQDYPLDFLLAYLNYCYSHRPNSLSITL